MPQLNINLTEEFEADLTRFMRIRKIPTKSEAVRVAVRESLERSMRGAEAPDFGSWLGRARGGENPSPRFASEDDLWES